MWIRTPIHLRNPLQFLQLCSHCISDTVAHFNSDDCNSSIPIDCLAKDANITSIGYESFLGDRETVRLKNVNRRRKKSKYEKINVDNNMDSNLSKQNQKPSQPVFSSEPPPLAFFPKYQRTSAQPIIFSSTEPPPLVPIERK